MQFVESFNTPAGIIAMRRLTGKGVKPIIGIYHQFMEERREIDKSWESHLFKKTGMRKISENLLKQLDEKIALYLKLSTQQQHVNSVLDQNNDYISSCGTGASDMGDLSLAEIIYDSLKAERHFDLKNNPDFRDLLFLEYNQGIILREPQVKTIRDMLNDPNAVRQLQMGGGKSKVLLPMLAQRKATGKNLVMLMLPEELYETNCRDLDQTNRQLFGQEMFRFDFSRSSDTSEKALQQIYLRMLKTVKNKGFMMTTKRSMLSFRNTYLELLHNLDSLPKDVASSERDLIIGQIRAMSKILKLFSEKTDVLADEVDACLDIRKEINSSLGDSRQIDQVKADVGAELMGIMLSAKTDEPLHELIAALQQNTQAVISPAKRKELMGDLAGAYYDRHSEQLSEVDRDSFVIYIMNKKDDRAQVTEEWVLKLKITNNGLFKEIATLKAFTDRGFGNTLGSIGNVNYGRDPISGLWSIPYKASNKAHVGSEFDDDIEQISYTIQDYIQNGVNYKQVYQIVAGMRNKAMTEMRQSKADELIVLSDTQGGKDFEAFIKEIDPKQKLGKNVNLATFYNSKNIEALVAVINSTPEGRLAFCHKQVIRNIKIYQEQINSLSADLTGMVNHFGGFTGTPWNLHTYDDKINAEKSLGVDGITWALMLGRGVTILSFAFDANKPIDSVLLELDVIGNYQAFIDTGAYLRGTSNDEFVDRVFEIAELKGKTIGSQIYFDKAGKIVKKRRRDEASLPIEVAPYTDLMTNFSLYDHEHGSGSDIKQGRKAKGLDTLGENEFLRDLFQAVWRFREYHKEQRIDIGVSNAIKERILGRKEGELSPEDVLKFCLMNQGRREAEDNFRAEKEKIQGFTKRLIFPQIVNSVTENISDDKIVELAHQFVSKEAGFYIKNRAQESAYDQYAKLKEEEKPSQIFERSKIEEIEKYKKAKASFENITNKSISESITSMVSDKLINRPRPPDDWFSELVESTDQAGVEVQQETQAEVAQELSVETAVEQQTQVVTETIIPMVQSGAAGHGDVVPLSQETILNTIKTGISLNTDTLRELSTSLDFFDPGIFCSAVFERNLSQQGGYKLSPQSAFYSNRKTVKNIVISKSNGRWTMIIPTIHEAHGGCREFIKKADSEIQAVEVAISAAKPKIIYKSGPNRSDAIFTDKDDQDQFYRLYIQAKLFNGEIEFGTDEEKEALKKWLMSKGAENFKTYFERNILSAKPKRFATAYLNSSLFAIFKELSP